VDQVARAPLGRFPRVGQTRRVGTSGSADQAWDLVAGAKSAAAPAAKATNTNGVAIDSGAEIGNAMDMRTVGIIGPAFPSDSRHPMRMATRHITTKKNIRHTTKKMTATKSIASGVVAFGGMFACMCATDLSVLRQSRTQQVRYWQCLGHSERILARSSGKIESLSCEIRDKLKLAPVPILS
jgi:hypothetical protein